MSTDLLPARLREAREAREMSLDALAEASLCSRQLIYKYENNRATPRPETLARIAHALRVPPDFFARPVSDLELTPLFFRDFRSKTGVKPRTAARRQLSWVQRLVRVLEKYVVLPEIDLPDFSPPSDPREIQDAQIEASATALRRHWGLGDGVITDLVKLLEGRGCIVVANLVDCENMDGFSQWEHRGRPYLAFDCRTVSPAHRRIDVAHELGHLILHRSVDKRFVTMSAATHKMIEEQAFRFASAFMMPEETFRRSVPFVSLESLLVVKPQWRLSVAAMLHRAQDLGIVDPQTAKRLWINRNRRGWKYEEPFESEIPFETPKLLSNAIFALRDSSPNALDQLCNEVGLYPHDIARYAGLTELDLSPAMPDFPVTLRGPAGSAEVAW